MVKLFKAMISHNDLIQEGGSSLALPSVSIVIPCRNEEHFIDKCLDSIVNSDFPKDKLEVLVVDGMSTDATRVILNRYSSSYGFIRILDNLSGRTTAAFNIGVEHAVGDLIMIMSAHATYRSDAIVKSAVFSRKYDPDNVGGVWKVHPRNEALIDTVIVSVLSHPFGVGGASYRTLSETDRQPRWVDTAAYGCYKRSVFKKIGLFNEELIRGQDMEFNLRLKNAGGRTLLVPDIVINYYARSEFLAFCKHGFRNGLWAILPFLYSRIMPVAWRHLVPLIFVVSLLGASLLSLFAPPFMWMLLVILSVYCLATLTASFQIAWRGSDPCYFIIAPFVFCALHICYGVGSLWGVIKLLVTPQFWLKFLGGEGKWQK